MTTPTHLLVVKLLEVIELKRTWLVLNKRLGRETRVDKERGLNVAELHVLYMYSPQTGTSP